MIKKLRVTVDGKPYEVTVELEDESAGALTPASAPARPTAAAAPAATTRPPVSAPASAAPAAHGHAGPGEVPSPLSGRVTAVAVSPGQQVKEGEQLLTLEAMKMNTFVFAPKSGTVAALHVAVGDTVNEHQPLLKIE